MSPDKSRIAGELRLRVTSSDDAASFESGSDLLQPDGRLWSRPLYALFKFLSPLYEKLREDRLIPDDLDTALAALPSRTPKYHRSHILYTLNDTFTVDFSSTTIFCAITEQGVQRLPFDNVFIDSRASSRVKPYTGAYTSHTSPSLDTPILIILMNF
jgi:hypothetical protein